MDRKTVESIIGTMVAEMARENMRIGALMAEVERRKKVVDTIKENLMKAVEDAGKQRGFRVIWHEENASGSPTNVMGTSKVFETREGAEVWVAATIDEDRVACNDSGDEIEVLYEKDAPPDLFARTETSAGKVCSYAIAEVAE